MSHACQPSFRGAGWTVRPGVPAGIMNDEISPSALRAVTVITVVIGVPELVMKALVPFEHPLVAVLGRPRPGRTGVAAGVGFGQPERGQCPSGDEVG